MVPLRDNARSRRFPAVTLLLILLNAAVWYLELKLPQNRLDAFFSVYGVVPIRYTRLPSMSQSGFAGHLSPLLSAAFIHAGWFHLMGNMLYLWVFGDNVEDRLGHLRFALFYLVTGVLSNVAHIIANPLSTVPTVGASGAVAGVLGAYFLMFPGAKVVALVPLGFVFLAELPAVVFIFSWFFLQLLNGIATIGVPAQVGGQVAYWAHIGGFLAGMVLCRVLHPKTRRYTH